MIPDLFWIVGSWRGRLAIAARPRGGDWLEDELNGWRLAGINVIVSLLESDEVAQLGLLEESRAAVAVHCRQGIGRSGLIAAGVLAASGTSPEDAIAAVSSARGLPVPETSAQRLWVQGLRVKPPVVTR
jgi:hypothetical protein